MYKLLRFLPYIIITTVAIILFSISNYVSNSTYKTIIINIGSNEIFLFIGYLFYDLIKSYIKKKEKTTLNEYINNQMANDIFVVLYYLKKIIHGYNLEANTLDNILNLVNYSKKEILNSILNQNYLGFQIFKQIDELRDIFKDVLNDNLILEYTTHVDIVNIIKINNLLSKIEYILKDSSNYNKDAESGIEYNIINGKEINPNNDDKYLLLKKTKVSDRYVVYDSGFFNKEDADKLLNRYVFKKETASKLAEYIYELFSLLKYWIPDVINLSRQENRFKIIKNHFSPYTNTKTIDSKIYVSDIVDKSNLT